MIKTEERFNNCASNIIKGDECRGYMEDVIQDHLFDDKWDEGPQPAPILFDITSDWYDQSLELHFAYMTDDVAVESFCKRKELQDVANFIYENGACHFWVNFHEKENVNSRRTHEIHFNKNLSLARLRYFKENSYTEYKHLDIEINCNSDKIQ